MGGGGLATGAVPGMTMMSATASSSLADPAMEDIHRKHPALATQIGELQSRGILGPHELNRLVSVLPGLPPPLAERFVGLLPQARNFLPPDSFSALFEGTPDVDQLALQLGQGASAAAGVTREEGSGALDAAFTGTETTFGYPDMGAVAQTVATQPVSGHVASTDQVLLTLGEASSLLTGVSNLARTALEKLKGDFMDDPALRPDQSVAIGLLEAALKALLPDAVGLVFRAGKILTNTEAVSTAAQWGLKIAQGTVVERSKKAVSDGLKARAIDGHAAFGAFFEAIQDAVDQSFLQATTGLWSDVAPGLLGQVDHDATRAVEAAKAIVGQLQQNIAGLGGRLYLNWLAGALQVKAQVMQNPGIGTWTHAVEADATDPHYVDSRLEGLPPRSLERLAGEYSKFPLTAYPGPQELSVEATAYRGHLPPAADGYFPGVRAPLDRDGKLTNTNGLEVFTESVGRDGAVALPMSSADPAAAAAKQGGLKKLQGTLSGVTVGQAAQTQKKELEE